MEASIARLGRGLTNVGHILARWIGTLLLTLE